MGERLIHKYVNNALCAASISHAAGTNRWQLTYGRDQEDRLRFGPSIMVFLAANLSSRFKPSRIHSCISGNKCPESLSTSSSWYSMAH